MWVDLQILISFEANFFFQNCFRCDFNKYTIKVIQEMAKLQILKDEENQIEQDSDISGDEDMLLVSTNRNGVNDDDDDVVMSDDDSDSD